MPSSTNRPNPVLRQVASPHPPRPTATGSAQRPEAMPSTTWNQDMLPLVTPTMPESWVEVSSHPSSSSVSSIGDEIVTTGLQVGASHGPRRRRLHPQSYVQPSQARFTESSQEEYDESESDEDHLLTSSTENMVPHPTPLRQTQVVQPDSSEEEDDDDDDDHATALGMGRRRPSEPFRPQPNAFSHPPSHLTHRHSTSSVSSSHRTPRPSFSQRSHTRVDRRTLNFMSPAYQADNDAALRASLTTLLSCAQAARSRPKDPEKEVAERPAPAGSAQPVELRFVAEKDLMAPSRPPAPISRDSSRSARTSPPAPSPQAPASPDKVKRSATPTQSSKSSRATKKKRVAQSEDTFISPTLLTWVVSAGVVVLVSVVGFGAGYVIGREVGRQETLGTLGNLGSAGNMSAVAEGGSCGKEIIRSSGGTLRRFRWGSGMGTSVALA